MALLLLQPLLAGGYLPRVTGKSGQRIHRLVGSVVHAMLIEGTMEIVSKALLCALVLAATVKVVVDRRVWTIRKRPKA